MGLLLFWRSMSTWPGLVGTARGSIHRLGGEVSDGIAWDGTPYLSLFNPVMNHEPRQTIRAQVVA